MSLEILPLEGFNKGVNKYYRPFLIEDDAFQTLDNVICYRGHIDKKPGLQIIGRLRRVFTAKNVGMSGPSEWSFNIWTLYGVAMPEASATIQPGSVIVTIGMVSFIDQGNGILDTGIAGNIGVINYLTGDVKITYNVLAGVTFLSFAYYPNLPVMSISQRETSGINQEVTIFFDTKYAYIFSGTDFVEFIPGTTWASNDYNFFWTVNYQGLNSSDRAFFVTNFLNNSSNPMRYTNGASWTDFKPVLAGTENVDIPVGTAIAQTTSFTANLPPVIIPNTVTITIGIVVVTDDGAGNLAGGGYTGTIDYETGDFTIDFNLTLPSDQAVTATYTSETTYLLTCLILIPYFGRFLALNTYEGEDYPGTNYFNRVRFSQIGDPLQTDAWRSDVFGKGGFIDAPVNQQIISVQFFKNVLIVHFERSTWRLQYIGEYGLPFIWERISTDFGSESTFSTVLFDEGILTVGDKAIIKSSGNDCQRIDLSIPDTIYTIRNTQNGPQRVHGVRDFEKELVYWTYPDYNNFSLTATQYFPNRTLTFNYRTLQFSFMRNNITCFGYFQCPSNITWGRTDIFWNDPNIFWKNFAQEGYPGIAAGNQVGFVHYFGEPESQSVNRPLIPANEQESLAITDIIVGADTQLVIPNHNLALDDWIYVANLLFINDTFPYTVGSSTLNNNMFYISKVVDVNTVQISKYPLGFNFPVTNVGTYYGGGVVALMPKVNIVTKDFNPAKMNAQPPQNIQTSYIDLLMNVTINSQLSINLLINSNVNLVANSVAGNSILSLANNEFGYIYNIVKGPTTIIFSRNHTVLTGEQINFDYILGMTQLNGLFGTATYIDSNSFRVDINSSGFDDYVSGGVWVQWNDTYYVLDGTYSWYRFYANVYGQYVALQLTYNDELMNNFQTHSSEFSLNAMKLYYRPAGSNIFGK